MKKFLNCALFALIVVSAAAQQPCTELFFSEYVEGSSNNKALEIYNPTAATVSLTGYKLQRYTNGSDTATATFNLTDSIAPGGVYVLINPQSTNAAILAAADTANSFINFNGNDAVTLVKDTAVIDVIGIIGDDPGTGGWPVSTGFTTDATLIRKPSVHGGTSDWSVGATEWNVLARDTTRLGAHTMTPCGDTTIRFMAVAATVNEAAGTYVVNVVLSEASPSSKTVDVSLLSGDAADIGNFTTATITIPANATTAPLSITITNDTLPEASEQFEFLLSNVSGGITIDADSIFILTITDDDSVAPPPPFRTIAEVSTVDADGLPDSLGVRCRVTGVVYGINLRDSGVQFVIHDGTGGMGVFSDVSDFGYTVQEGDSVVVSGEVGEFAGYTQMEDLDTIYQAGTGTLRAPTVVTALNESTESELVRINNLTLLSPAAWNNSNPAGFTVDVTNGVDTFGLRIEEQTDLFNQNAPPALFDVIGLGSQFDNSAPHNTGYQIVPRSSADLLLRTGIHDATGIDFVIYPNPNEGVFTIRIDARAVNGFTVKITDLACRVIIADTNRMAGTATVDLSQAARGFYIVEIAADNALIRKKISIQ